MLKKLLLSIVVLVLIAGAGVPAYFYGAYPKMRPAPAMTALRTPDALERGRYLVTILGCANCHSPVDDTRPGDFPVASKLFAGRVFPADMGLPGTVVAPNLSSDPDSGLGHWTDGEIARAIREGVSRDGRPLFPMMNYPNYARLPDTDVMAIVAYLRTAPPQKGSPGQTKLDFPVNMLIRTVPQPLAASPAPLPAPGVERGKVLIALGMCTECHTQSEKGQPKPGMYLAGGSPAKGPWGTVYAANITAHPSAGIGAYSDEDLRRVFREGRNRSGRQLWVMPWSATRHLDDEDLNSLIAALRQVPANPNLVPAPELKKAN
jgi:mono/diheme cytochrome c family protein